MFAVTINRTIKIFGRRMAELRIRAGLSQSMLAAEIGASPSGVHKIERKEIASIFVAKRPKLIAALRITDDQFEKELLVSPEDSALDDLPTHQRLALQIPFPLYSELRARFATNEALHEFCVEAIEERAKKFSLAPGAAKVAQARAAKSRRR